MKKNLLLISVAMLSFGVINESWAEDCVMDEAVYVRTCRSGIDQRGINANGEYICGTDCTFTIEGTTIKVKANSANAKIDNGIFSPYYYSGGKVVNNAGQEINFNKIELDGDFAYIGEYAFSNSGATITSTSGVLNVKHMGMKVFKSNANNNTKIDADVYILSDTAADSLTFQDAKINGDLVFADGVTEVATWFMGKSDISGSIIIPDSMNYIGADNFLLSSTEIYCRANNCYELFYDSCNRDTREYMLTACLDWLNQLQQNGQLSSYPEGCTKLGVGLECSKCANNNFKLSDGVCRRVRYTPAEAAEVVGESNTIFLYYK